MKIPVRIHSRDPLPGNAIWIITNQRGQLVVYLAPDVPEDSPLEQQFVRQAVRAWRRNHHHMPVIVPPITVGGAAAWIVRQLRRPAVGAGAGIAAVSIAAAAVIITDPGGPAHHRPPAATAPPAARPSHPTDGTPPAPVTPRPGRPSRGSAPRPPQPSASTPPGGEDAAVAVTRRLPVRVRVPKVPRLRRPVVPHPPVSAVRPPVTVPPHPPPGPSCRLVKVHVGKLIQVCL